MPRRYQWNANASRFRDPTTGRFISRQSVRSVIDQGIAKSQQRIQATSDAYRRGVLSLGEWQSVMREEIKRTHLAAEMLARGGRAQMTPADFGRVGQRVREQYAFLRDFAEQLATREIRTDGTFLNRAKLYAGSSRVAFHESLGDVLTDAGYTLERSILHPAEHCATCVSEAARGYVSIGSLIPIGSRTCLGNDRCSMLFR